MGKIFCVMGKSSSGKDTLYQMLKKELEFDSIVPYTTRPIREGETNGVEYHFVTEEEVAELEEAGKIIELRAYNTVHGIWKYFTADDAQIDLEYRNYLMIGTVEAYQKLKAYYGEEHLVPIYIEVDDGIRLQRALNREKLQEQPKYAEMCRRFLADCQDFSYEKLEKAGIGKYYANDDLESCIDEIKEQIISSRMV